MQEPLQSGDLLRGSIERLLLDRAAYAYENQSELFPRLDDVNWWGMASIKTSLGTFGGPKKTKFPYRLLREDFQLGKLREFQAEVPIHVPDPRMHRDDKGGSRGLRFYCLDEDGAASHTEYEIVDVPLSHLPNTGSPALGSDMQYKHGWWMSQLLMDETNLWGRYADWQANILDGELGNRDIWHLPFQETPHPAGMNLLYACLDTISIDWRRDVMQKWLALEFLLDWFLWSFGHHGFQNPPLDHWDGRCHDRLMQIMVSPKAFHIWPCDYFGALIEELNADGSKRLPKMISMDEAIEQAKLMFPPTFSLKKWKKPSINNKDAFLGTRESGKKTGFASMGPFSTYRDQMVVDLETGSGRLLLAASNYTYELFGTNTHSLLSKAALINFYLYCPWAIWPLPYLQKRSTAPTRLENLIARAVSLVKAKGLREDYLTVTQRDTEYDYFLPIQQRCNLRLSMNQVIEKVAEMEAQQPVQTVSEPPADLVLNLDETLLPGGIQMAGNVKIDSSNIQLPGAESPQKSAPRQPNVLPGGVVLNSEPASDQGGIPDVTHLPGGVRLVEELSLQPGNAFDIQDLGSTIPKIIKQKPPGQRRSKRLKPGQE